MPKTKTFTVNNVDADEPITPETYCRQLTIREDSSVVGYPTTAFIVRAPESTDNPEEILAGEKKVFREHRPAMGFQPGRTIGYVATKVGSTTFVQYEE